MPIDAILYLVTGSIAGIAAGLLGIGGGLIIVPVLFTIFSTQNIDPSQLMHIALATSLASIIITSISSTRAHHKKQAVLWPIFFMLAPGICIGAWLGGNFAASLHTEVLKPIFGLFELTVAIHLLSQHKTHQLTQSINRIKTSVGGLLIGFVSAIVGIGGGTLTVPFLHWHNIAIRNAVATSAVCGLPIALFGTLSFIVAGWGNTSLPTDNIGYVNLTAFTLIATASYFTAPIGATLAHKLPEQTLKTGFGVFLLLISIKMLFL